MTATLEGCTIAILTTDGFEQSELAEPKAALEAEGARVEIVAPSSGSVRGWDRTDWGEALPVDRSAAEVTASRYDGLLLPGGVINADHLRMNADAVALVSEFLVNRKPLAAICHAPWLLIEADGVAGRRMTAYPSLRTDLVNAGARWEDAETVVEGNVLTSRRPDDLPAFSRSFIEMVARTRQPTSADREYRMVWDKGV